MQYELNSKQRKTLKAIFEKPTRSDILWTDAENLFIALGAVVQQGKGSRVRVALNGIRAVFHEPHPEKEVSKATVTDIRDFLERAAISPQ